MTNYKFNYKEYSERYYGLYPLKEDSQPLEYYPYNNDHTQYLFPGDLAPSLLFNVITEEYKEKVGKLVESKGYSNFEIIAAISGSIESFPIIIDKNNGRIMSINFGVESMNLFVSSSLEQFADSLIFYEEYEKQKEANYNEGIDEHDCITDEMVFDLFAKIGNIDPDAVKEGAFFYFMVINGEIQYHKDWKNGLIERDEPQKFTKVWNEEFNRYDVYNTENQKVAYLIWNDKHTYKRWDYVLTNEANEFLKGGNPDWEMLTS